MNPFSNKIFFGIFGISVPLIALFSLFQNLGPGWSDLVGSVLVLLYVLAIYGFINPLAKKGGVKDERFDIAVAEHQHKVEQIQREINREKSDALLSEHLKDGMRKRGELFSVLGEEFRSQEYPKLYAWHKNNPETLATFLKDLANKLYDGEIWGAAQALESDLENQVVSQ